MLIKISIFLYISLYMGTALGLRPYILYKRTGINVFKQVGSKGVKGFIEKVLMFGTTLLPLIAIVILTERFYEYLVPIQYLEIPFLQYTGCIFMIFGVSAAIIAQFQMGDSWRIGFNETHKTELITKGFYGYSRNPIYVGLVISLLGFFLAAPNALSLCCLVLSYPSIQIKILMEEEYMLSKHGKDFEEYMKSVRRWI